MFCIKQIQSILAKLTGQQQARYQLALVTNSHKWQPG